MYFYVSGLSSGLGLNTHILGYLDVLRVVTVSSEEVVVVMVQLQKEEGGGDEENKETMKRLACALLCVCLLCS